MSPKRWKLCGFLWSSFRSLIALLLLHCISQFVTKVYPGSREGHKPGTQILMGQWQNSEWACEMGNIVTDTSGKYDLPCFPFSLANGILLLIRVLNFNEVQCISLLCVCQLRKRWWKKESLVYFKVMWLYLILSWPLSYKVLRASVFTEEEIEAQRR